MFYETILDGSVANRAQRAPPLQRSGDPQGNLAKPKMKNNYTGKTTTALLMSLGLTLFVTPAHTQMMTPQLSGIGYFGGNDQAGVGAASLGGGVEVMMYGQGFSHSPASHIPIFSAPAINFQGAGQCLSQDNQFQSYTDGAKLEYTTPSWYQLSKLAYEQLWTLDSITYDVSLLATDDMTGETYIMKCPDSSASKCRVTLSRAFTPFLHYISPAALYPGQEMAFWVDPRSTQNIKSPTEWPFMDARINGYTVDFNDYVDETTSLSAYTRNQIRGLVGDNVAPNASADVSMRFKAGNTLYYDPTALRCDYTNTTCYHAKVLPAIQYIDAFQGYTTGGQLLTIQGQGFNKKKTLDVKVDGQPCIVKSNTQNEIKCLTQASASPSNQSFYIGQHGLRRKIFNTTNGLNYGMLNPSVSSLDILATDFEAQVNYKNGPYANVFSGYFQAPADAKYKFYLSCDDICKLNMGNVSGDPTMTNLVLSVTSYTSYRSYYASDWLTLTKGSYYFMEALHIQSSGGDHFTLSVEINDPNIEPGHHHTVKEIQRLQINQNLVREQTQVTITNPDNGKFIINIQNPLNNQLWASPQLTTNATASVFESAIIGYYNLVWGAPISVTKDMYDSTGNLTTILTQSVKSVFNITVYKSLAQASTNYVNFQKVTTKSTLQFKLPRDSILSTPPIKGAFFIRCALPNGAMNISLEIGVKNATWQIRDKINQACPNYKEKYDIWDGPKYSYYEDGRDLYLRFHGLNYDIPQFEIISADANPVIGNIVSFDISTPLPWDPTHIFYEPVPYDFLFTNETKPQVMVTVDGLQAVCSSLLCDYNYLNATATIDDFSLSGNTLTIAGTSLPTDVSELRSVKFAKHDCSVLTTSETQITCTAQKVAGQWQPEVVDYKGIIPVTVTKKLQVPLVVESVTPNSNVNLEGGNLIAIKGQNFPETLDKSGETYDQLKVSLSDSDQECVVASVTKTSIECMTGKFSSGIASSTVTVQLNTETDATQVLSFANISPMITDLQPAKASPVLKGNLTIKIDWASTLDKSDLTVKLVDILDPSNVWNLNIIEISNTNGNKYLKVRYGGAYSGNYTLIILSKDNGAFGGSFTFEAVGKVISYYPTIGSLYGGTLITINGYNFSDSNILDNPVRTGYTDCLVQTTTNNQITCRTLPRMEGEEGTDDFIVFLKASEEAVMTMADRTYNWTKTGLPTVQSYSTSFDATISKWVLTLVGTGFGNTPTGLEFFIDDMTQTFITVTDTQITIQIDNMLDTVSRNVKFYFPIGTPEGMELFLGDGIVVSPKFVSLATQTGSPAGSLIVANVQGVGYATIGISLVNALGASVCSSVKIERYGEFQCRTLPATLTTVGLRAKLGTDIQSCQTANACDYQTDANMPSITTGTLSDDNTIVLTGSNLDSLSGFTASVKFGGISATTVNVVDSTQVTAAFDKGVPIVSVAQAPELIFKSNTGLTTHWASVSASLSRSLTISTIDNSASPISCSFAGGCLLSLTQPGLFSTITQDDDSQVRVCSQTCIPSISDSSVSTFKCLLPPLATTQSMLAYNISNESYLLGTPFSSKSALTAVMFDGINQKGWNDKATNCSFGTAFKPGFVGVIREVKYFMNRFTKVNIAGKLTFQGSQDGVTYTDIFQVGQEIHEGWNYHTFESGKEQKYRYYRFFGNGTSSCMNVGEIAFAGVEVIDSNADTYSSCPIDVIINGTAPVTLAGTVTYSSTLTPLLKSISPRFGSVEGGDVITFSGVNFSPIASTYTILIDGQPCAVIDGSASTTQVKCTTAKRPGVYLTSTLDMKVSGMGSVATQGMVYRYASLWSQDSTWGGEFAPIEGDMVYVPTGLNLLVDVDSTPILSAVLVEGSLIFAPDSSDPNHQKTFDAHYILVRNGYMEVGTEEFPYTSKLTITMHSNKQSPEIPIYGNKVIGVRNGILDMHGVARDPVWTELDTTAQIGDKTITLIRAVDWQAGERIVIAPSGYDNSEVDELTIVSVDRTNPNKPIITVDRPLTFKHYAGIQNFGTAGEFIEMRSEVGLLTRNVVYRGDPYTSSDNQFGAHIMLHSKGDESVIGRIEFIELRDVGQAFQLGRYPIHFHMVGTVHKSYIHGNAIHHTYNRAVTIHGVHYLRVTNNVAYKTMGHTFFIEDAAETKNYLENNLAIFTQRSWSLLNTDQSPASFWITHPDNIFRGNHAAGAANYGFWFDTKPHPMGPSFDPNICPENAQLGEFVNNVAHSNGKYGLRIFHALVPRLNPCSALVYDANNTADPYWKNPLITARFQNFTSWKNLHVGAIAERVGDVRFENFKVADNLIAGIEFSLTTETADGTAQLNGALVIGHSENADSQTMGTFSHGIITPRYENFQVHNVSFYNFDVAGKAAIGSCSHCFHPAATDSGARTITFSNMKFDNATVTTKIKYQYPFRDIFWDTDGTLTGKGANSWATPYWRHNEQPECTTDLDVYDGILCDSRVQVRRIVFNGYSPNIFQMMSLKLLQIDDGLFNKTNDTEKEAYYGNTSLYSEVPFKKKQDPMNAWAVPIVTGHAYKAHWQYGLDFTTMSINLSPRWTPADKNLYIMMNFTDVRAKVEVITAGEIIPNMTLVNKTASQWQTGDNVIYNDTDVREIHIAINGKNASRNYIKMNGYRCDGTCPGMGAIVEKPLQTTVRYWSNPNDWTKGVVPKFNETVEIESGWNMVFDLEESPIFDMVQINGQLSFDQTKPKLHLRAKYIFVRAGALLIGSQDSPFPGDAKITLHGEKQNAYFAYTGAIEAGNKILANINRVEIYGKQRATHTRLTKTAKSGDSSMYVATGLDWVAGDKLGIFPTTIRYYEADYAIVSAYDATTGLVTLDRPLSFTHFGAATTTGTKYNGLDIRGEVVLLSRNVQIVGEDIEAWGCQVVTSDYMEEDGKQRTGMTILDSVEIFNCSQYDTQKAALRFEMANGAYSRISNSAIHHGLGLGIQTTAASNMQIENNTIFDFVRFGVNIESSSNITVKGNLVGDINSRNLVGLDSLVDVEAGILACAYQEGDYCSDIFISNNIVAGTTTTGYSAPGHKCGDYSKKIFFNNTAHSVQGSGAIIFKHPADPTQSDCLEGSYFNGYKITEAAVTSYASTKQAIFSFMTLLDNHIGCALNVGSEGDELWAKVRNSKFYGDSDSKDCDVQNFCKANPDDDACVDRSGLFMSYFSRVGKPALIRMKSALPYHKIKTDASFGGNILYENNLFSGYSSSKTFCGAPQKVIRMNDHAADYQPRTKFLRTTFENIDQDSVAFIFNPPRGWANMDDCGNFPCTAPSNVLLQFEKTTFNGTIKPVKTDSDFQIVSNNVVNVANYSSCKQVQAWNAYYCNNYDLGVLLFESLDDDKFKRMITPITLKSYNITSSNVLNTFMDHIWDGFYTGQLRMSRWPALIQVSSGSYYEILYTGTPPSSQRFRLIADQGNAIIKIKYTKPGAYVIKDANKNLIKLNQWDNTLKQPGLIKGSKGGYCGENRYRGVINELEFYITPGCDLYIEPIDSIYASIRLNWTMDGFYANGGTTQFVDRLAASLGIHAANIKIVSVYQGSVVIQTMIVDDPKFPLNASSAGNLTNLQAVLTDKLLKKSMNLGAPIIGADIKGLSVDLVSDASSATNTVINPLPTTLPGDTNTQPIVQPKPVVIVNEQNQVVEVTTSESKAAGLDTGVVAAVTVVIVLLVVVSSVGFYCYRRNKGTVGIDSPKQVHNQSINNESEQHSSIGNVNMETYELQYHPKAEIGSIFGWEDPVKKQNQADIIHEEDDEGQSPDRFQMGHQNFQEGEHFATSTPDYKQQDNTPLHEPQRIEMGFNEMQNTGVINMKDLKLAKGSSNRNLEV